MNENWAANKPIRYTFYFDVKNLLSFTSQLNIRNAVKQDEGQYQCQMRYKQGSNPQTLTILNAV